MLTVLCGHRGRMTAAVLRPLLDAHERREAQLAYLAQTLWLVGARLDALLGADVHMPRYDTLFPARRGPAQAGDIRSGILRGLASMEDKEVTTCPI